MAVTTRFSIPKVADTDAPNGPAQINAVADATDALLAKAGAQSGKSIIATDQSTTSATDVALGTPDQVTGIVLPTDGLIFVAAQGMVKQPSGTGVITVYLGSNPVKAASTGTAPQDANTGVTGGFTDWRPFATSGGGLVCDSTANIYAGDVTTGQLVGINKSGVVYGGPMAIFAAAGTYDVSLRYRTGGTINAKNRKLWVWTQEF